MNRTIAVILAGVCGAAIILMYGSTMAMINIWVLLGMLLLVTFMTICIHGYQNLWNAVSGILSTSESRERQEIALQVVQTIDQSTLGAGTLCLIAGVLLLFANMQDPFTIGTHLSLALTGSLYGLIMSRLLCYPLGCSLRLRLGKASSNLCDSLVFNLFQLMFPLTCFLSFLIVVFSLL